MKITTTTSRGGISVSNPSFCDPQMDKILNGRSGPPTNPPEITKPKSFCSLSNVTKSGIAATIVSLWACVFGCVKDMPLVKWLGLAGSAISAGIGLVGFMPFGKTTSESPQNFRQDDFVQDKGDDVNPRGGERPENFNMLTGLRGSKPEGQSDPDYLLKKVSGRYYMN